MAATEKISLANVDIGERTVGGREAESQREFPRRLFFNLGSHHRLIRRRSLGICHPNLLEEAEILDALLRSLHLSSVEGIALDQLELAAYHLVEGTNVANDVDPLDVNLRALLHAESNIDRVIFAISGDVGSDLDKRIAPIAQRLS